MLNDEIDLIRSNWEEMFFEKKHLAEDLAVYALSHNGYVFTPYSFTHLIPPAITESLMDENDIRFNDYLYDIIFPQTLEKDENITARFIDQFLRNNPTFSSEMKLEDINIINRTNGTELTQNLKDIPNSFEIKNASVEKYNTPEGIANGLIVFPEYFHLRMGKNSYLYKEIETGYGVYQLEDALGVFNKVQEYNYNGYAMSRFNPIMSIAEDFNSQPGLDEGLAPESDPTDNCKN